jgi:hypothetical protein
VPTELISAELISLELISLEVTSREVTPAHHARVICYLFTDFTGDRADDAAAVLQCSASGVSWPVTVRLYWPGPPTFLDSVALMSVHEAEHADITTMTAENDDIRLRWSTHNGCCIDPMTWTARLHWTANTEDPRRHPSLRPAQPRTTPTSRRPAQR